MRIPEEGIEYTISSVEQLGNILSEIFAKPKSWYEHTFEAVGWGFVSGGVCGTAFDFFKGMHDSPKGQRLSGASKAVSKNGAFRFGPIVAAHFGCQTALDCFLEDNIRNSVFSGAATFGGIKLIRTREICSAARSTLYGGLLLGSLWTAVAFMERANKAKGKNH